MKKITKAVFPVGGMGTRFLPATKANPKEMLPIVDKPLIQYAVEEAIASGITELIFVTSSSKRAIEDHFDQNFELEYKLESRNKQALLDQVKDIVPAGVSCIYLRQPEALGLGHAVLCAKPVVRNDPFAVILADDLITSTIPCIGQMNEVYQENNCSVLGIQEINPEETERYGIIGGQVVDDKLSTINQIVEKPSAASAPSNLGVVGRYILTPRVFHWLETLPVGAGAEIQLTDAIGALIQEEKVLSYMFDGVRYDCGDKLGYLIATVELARNHPELSEGFNNYLRDIIN